MSPVKYDAQRLERCMCEAAKQPIDEDDWEKHRETNIIWMRATDSEKYPHEPPVGLCPVGVEMKEGRPESAIVTLKEEASPEGFELVVFSDGYFVMNGRQGYLSDADMVAARLAR